MNKRGFELSFSMIFSIIIIISILGVAFYAISYFINLGKCTEVSIFYRDFQGKVDTAWNSEIARDEFNGRLPSGIDSVCIGNLSVGGSGEQYEEFRIYDRMDYNVFLYPMRKTCDMPYKKINHLDTESMRFTCFPVQDGQVTVGIDKGSFDSLVKIG